MDLVLCKVWGDEGICSTIQFALLSGEHYVDGKLSHNMKIKAMS
jgi:hypothetical protein